MEYLKIKNDGLLDMRLIYLMGGTTKANDKFKIGHFGTGLKYTLAYLLRNNILFHIFIDGKEIEISVKKEVIRDNEFNIIYINGDKTSITTGMGTEWKAWMIIREIWCNALDEVNGLHSIVTEINPEQNTTEFYIQLTGEVKEVFENWNKYFIHNQEPIQDSENFALYPGGETLRIYKNGVLIKEFEHEKSVFAYDIKDAVINELREFHGSAAMQITYCLPKFQKKAIGIFLDTVRGKFEEKMDYEWYVWDKYHEDWKKSIGNAKFIDYETYDKLVDREPEISKMPVVKVPKGLYNQLVKHFPTISMLRVSSSVNSFYETFSNALNEKIKKCVNILAAIGYIIDTDLIILTGVFGDPKTQGNVNFDTKEIHISADMENLSEVELMYVLVEEMEHYRTGFSDCTREFQSHFLRLYVNSILKEQKQQLALN